MNEDNLNIILFCLDYSRDNASLGVTQEKIEQAKQSLISMRNDYNILKEERENIKTLMKRLMGNG
jgi:hypothetical protein